MTHNNQLKVGLDDGGVGEDARQGQNVWGDAVSSVRSSNKWTKIMREEDGAMAVGCRHSTKGHNNQPTSASSMEMTSVKARDRGGRFTFIWGDELSGKNKQK